MSSTLMRSLILSTMFAAAMTGCAEKIGADASQPELKGDATQEQIFPGGPLQNSTTLSASSLKVKETYKTDGKLVLLGDVPANVSLNINNGKLVIDGNVGSGTEIKVSQPLVEHTNRYSCYTYGFTIEGKIDYGFVIDGCSDTVIDGLKYNDPQPAVEIKGAIGPDVKINTPGKIVIGNRQIPNKNQVYPVIGF